MKDDIEVVNRTSTELHLASTELAFVAVHCEVPLNFNEQVSVAESNLNISNDKSCNHSWYQNFRSIAFCTLSPVVGP